MRVLVPSILVFLPAIAFATPKLELIKPLQDFGSIPKGQVVTATFQIKNAGDTPLEIRKATPTCGCTATEFDKLIMPGKTGKLVATVDTAAFAGPISKAVTIETNDEMAPVAQVTITAVVKPYVEAYPAGFVRFNMLVGDVEKQSVTLYAEEGPFSIVGIEAPEWIDVKSTLLAAAERIPKVGADGVEQYRIDITVDAAKKKTPGPLAEKILVRTSSRKAPEFSISVSGTVRPAYRVEPTAVNFGEVSPSDMASTRVITIRSNNLKTPEAFKVTTASSSVHAIAVTLAPTANKGEYAVTLQVSKGAPAGAFRGEVTVATTDAGKPTVVIPIAGTIRP